jgi:hypothetical protein
MKSYVMYRPDLADTAAVEAEITANPPAYTVGTIVVALDGAANIVVTNVLGVSPPTFGLITVT